MCYIVYGHTIFHYVPHFHDMRSNLSFQGTASSTSSCACSAFSMASMAMPPWPWRASRYDDQVIKVMWISALIWVSLYDIVTMSYTLMVCFFGVEIPQPHGFVWGLCLFHGRGYWVEKPPKVMQMQDFFKMVEHFLAPRKKMSNQFNGRSISIRSIPFFRSSLGYCWHLPWFHQDYKLSKPFHLEFGMVTWCHLMLPGDPRRDVSSGFPWENLTDGGYGCHVSFQENSWKFYNQLVCLSLALTKSTRFAFLK